MQKILRVSGEGFKAQPFDVKLDAPTLVVGPNGAGKTSILQAIEFGVLGYVSSVGKQPKALIQLANKGGFTVSLCVATEEEPITGVWSLRKSGDSAKANIEFVPARGVGGGGAQNPKERIAWWLGMLGAQPCCIDFGAFLGLSRRAKGQLLAELCPGQAPSETIEAIIDAWIGDLSARRAEEAEELKAAILAHCPDGDLSDQLVTLSEFIEGRLSEARRSLREAEATLSKLGTIEESIAPQDLTEQIAGEEARYKDLHKRIVEAASIAQKRADSEGRIATLEEQQKKLGGGTTHEKVAAAAQELSTAEAAAETAQGMYITQLGEIERWEQFDATVESGYCSCPVDGEDCPRSDAIKHNVAENLATLREAAGQAKASYEEAKAKAKTAQAEATRLAQAEQAQSQKLELTGKLSKLPLAINTASWEKEMEAVGAKLKELRQQQADRQEADGQRKLLVQIRHNCKAGESVVELLGSLRDALGVKGALSREVERVTQPVIEFANEFLGKVGMPALRLEIDDNGGIDFALAGGFEAVHWATLSDSERCIVTLALQAGIALSSDASCRPLLLDRVEAIDAERLPKALAALADLADQFSCIVVAGTITDTSGAAETWNVIRLGE